MYKTFQKSPWALLLLFTRKKILKDELREEKAERRQGTKKSYTEELSIK